jgi:hypothetical protein
MQLLLICQIKFGEINPDIAVLEWLVVIGWWLRRGCVDARNRAIICHLLSAVLGFDKPFGRLRRALDRRRLPSAVCRPLSAVCCPPSAVCRPLSAVRRPPSAVRCLLSAVRYHASSACRQGSGMASPSSIFLAPRKIMSSRTVSAMACPVSGVTSLGSSG